MSWEHKLMIDIFAQATWHAVAACRVTGKYHFQTCYMDTWQEAMWTFKPCCVAEESVPDKGATAHFQQVAGGIK